MVLGGYHFDGEPDDLVPAYERLMAGFRPESLDLHVAVVRDGGLTVYDACPSEAVFASFSASADFADAVRAAGLPVPRVELLGNVVDVRAGTKARR
jgi:hypothetical protein